MVKVRQHRHQWRITGQMPTGFAALRDDEIHAVIARPLGLGRTGDGPEHGRARILGAGARRVPGLPGTGIPRGNRRPARFRAVAPDLRSARG